MWFTIGYRSSMPQIKSAGQIGTIEFADCNCFFAIFQKVIACQSMEFEWPLRSGNAGMDIRKCDIYFAKIEKCFFDRFTLWNRVVDGQKRDSRKMHDPLTSVQSGALN